ncbi:MAG: hypothetical protein J0M24_03965 [Verrucomicrobia bacterium]|nr:hypothetical protein [Verrucomicrobiota bacterium]
MMKRLLKTLQAALILAALGVGWEAVGQVDLPIEYRLTYEGLTPINFQSAAGVPISSTVGTPPGSDGRQPTGNESTGVFTQPTSGQFGGLMSFGSVAGLTQANWLAASNSAILQAGATPFSAVVAAEMRLPRAEIAGGAMVLRRAMVGAPFLSRNISFSFGSIVAPPEKDERGVILTVPNTAYWLPEPYTTSGHTGEGYYWSRHARLVYAIQPGPLAITWRKATPYSLSEPPPSDYVNPNGPVSFQTNGANIFVLYTERYIVSGSASKPPRRMYWTQKGFQNIGVPVAVPSGRLGAVNVVYNSSFPQTVAEEFSGIGSSSPTDGSTNQPLSELRTLWYEQQGQVGNIYAYNAEGRVFVELLGDLRSDGETYQQLGTEIVDVSKQAVPSDVTIELGERIIPPAGGSLDELFPQPIQQSFTGGFAYQRSVAGAERNELYAIKETINLNDYLVHWLETGEAGLRWPKLFGRYRLAWPTDIAKYSQYLRPPATTDAEAAATAVVLNPENAPNIDFQDPLDRPRAKFTPEFKFYTWLDAQYPVHRTLLRFVSGENIAFERVFSWYDANLRTTNFAGSGLSSEALRILRSLDAWNDSQQRFDWPADLQLTAPRVVNQSVEVGARINAPMESDVADGEGYVAGRIQRAIGTSYNVNAYIDPFDKGFAEANRGAIIPVNAIPNSNHLEVWWFRQNNARAGLNAGNTVLGFQTIYWPSVIGRYTLEWPADPREIVLASKLGGTGLSPSEALGTIYFQNDPARDGYNPNEEHAIMSGGTPFATRDDLNILTHSNQEYSSEPFVLVDYPHLDGRPAMAVFKVLREKPEAGWVFDYLVPAGQLLQPPPPLNFLGKPVEGSGDLAVNYNTEPTGGDGDLPGGWTTDAESGRFGHYNRFTFRDRHHDFWVYRGPHAGLPALEAGTYDLTSQSFQPLNSATAVVGQEFAFTVHASRQDEFLTTQVSGAPAWLSLVGSTLKGTPQSDDVGTRSVQIVVRDLYDQSSQTNVLNLEVVASGVMLGQAPLSIRSTNVHTGSIIEFTNRAPFLAVSPTPTNSFTLRYYYRTEPSFAWPGVATPPVAGSIVPYLRKFDATAGEFVGDPGSRLTPSLDIVYRPFWPERDPKDSRKPVATLPYGGTLAEPKFELPGVRDFKTASILYQQSIAQDLGTAVVSAVLHDPTRAKYVEITEQFETELPAGIRTETQQGKVYFPGLPPHLVNRVFVDPDRGTKGSLALIGEYKKELLGESYLLLNVLRGSDLAAVHALCPTNDAVNYPKWVALVNDLSSSLETFREDLPARPGTYAPSAPLTVSVGVGDLANIVDDNTAVDSYALSGTGPGSGYITVLEANGTAFTQPGDPVAMHIFKVGERLDRGELKILPSPNPLSELVTFQHTADLAGRFAEYEYEWKIAAPVDGFPPEPDAAMSRYLALTPAVADLPRYTLGGAGIQALGDNYVVMRYRPISTNHPLYVASPSDANWSEWTRPALAEGWIKRVLAGINPFNQRINDLFNNRVNTDVSIITQAGRRWEGDIALNIDTINNYGLIEIYETVLRRGRSLSIESGFNYGPANDALLLAAGYLNDLYMMLGNEAWADAANPTIGIGTADRNYGDIATALFAFRGQVPSVLDEELALIRGRDDFFQPGVEITPVYNRLIWNYTRGIDAGEVIYALNYNIQENPNQQPDGIINAADAARMFPQGHGDAYGHYLTALKGYYSLLMNGFFDWVPRIEAVNVLSQPVSVDYQDERKFAAAAVALARAGNQAFDLTWRSDYSQVAEDGWEHFEPTRVNTRRTYQTTEGAQNPERFWGMDHWASRVGQGTYLNWVIGNAILPDVDPIPTHEGIQKVDRTTVPELRELTTLAQNLQNSLENAEGGISPLGIPEDGMVFDLNPNKVVGVDNGTHFGQVYDRALGALKNAVTAFDDAKDVTRLLRSEQDSLAEFQATLQEQEQSYTNALIELYGTPYTDDIGPGKLYVQGYRGPDLVHYKYVDLPEAKLPEIWSYSNTTEWTIPLRDLPSDWVSVNYTSINFPTVTNITFNIGPHGFAEKPASWTGRRASPGQIQQAISEQIMSHLQLRQTINDAAGDLVVLQKAIDIYEADRDTYDTVRDIRTGLLVADEVLEKAKFANDLFQKYQDSLKEDVQLTTKAIYSGLPLSLIAGVAAGGDLTSAGRSALEAAGFGIVTTLDKIALARYTVVSALELAVNTARRQAEFNGVEPLERDKERRNAIHDLGNQLGTLQGRFWTINERLRDYDDKQRQVRALIAAGDRLQAERAVARQRAAAVVQGFRTRDAAFRIFRNEKLERYKTLFDLAARYALLAANAYDYETGLLGTPAGRDFKNRIISARALGVILDGEPQYAGSNTGDPGLSSVLAELQADWQVVRDRLGINRPDTHSTTVSVRTEKERILPGADGDTNWQDLLNRARLDNILDDADVRRFCMQADVKDGLPVPGLVISFSTTIANGLNLFGKPLAGGDHSFSPTSFATKIGGVGVAFEGYVGMEDPEANEDAVAAAGGVAAGAVASWFLDPDALAATPYIYLIPVGVDSMRSPPLGDTSQIRSWNVQDLAIPMPFNLGGSPFSTPSSYVSADSLSEPLFNLRKHAAFRPVSDKSKFDLIFYSDSLPRNEFINNRLVGRSVWNSQWKLVVPGRALLNNPNEGLDRFIRTVKDIKINFTTYSYNGN